MPLFLDTCQLLPCWKIQVLILGIWRNTNISQNLSKFWVLLLSSGDPVECSASCAHLHFHEVMNWQRSGGGVFCLPLMSICNPPIEWYLNDIWYLYVVVSVYLLSVHYIIVGSQVCTPIYSCCKHLYEPVFFGERFFKTSWPDVVISLPGWPIPTIWPTSRRMWCSISWATDRFLSRARDLHMGLVGSMFLKTGSCDHFDVRKWLNIIISSKLLQGSAWGIRHNGIIA